MPSPRKRATASSKKKKSVRRSSKGPAKKQESRLSELEKIARTAPTFRDESLAPELDEDLLRALVRRELPQPSARLVYRLVYSFKSWHEAHTRILVEEFRRNHS